MKMKLFPRLAWQNLWLNRRFYLPYLLTGIFTVAMFYNIMFITVNEGLSQMRGGAALQSMMAVGSIVIAICSIIFLLYSNSFLMKRRQKELGMYNILGMGKRHIALLLMFEALYTAVLALVIGLATGVLISKLLLLILYKLLSFSAPLGFSISWMSILFTLLLFCCVYALTLVINLIRIRLSNPIALLYGGNRGEREPKTKIIMTILGLLSLGSGYYIAITTESPIDAIGLFFVAVLLVIIGTYLLFTAGSIALLKILRKNKGYYYKTRHFTSVSGMLYRMKQNAVGLASICILSTMVLVLISTTVCLYTGVEDSLETRYNGDMMITAECGNDSERAYINDNVKAALKLCGRKASNYIGYTYINFAATLDGEQYNCSANNYTGLGNAKALCVMTAEQYKKLTGTDIALSGNEVAFGSSNGTKLSYFTLFKQQYTVVKELTEKQEYGDYIGYLLDVNTIIVADDARLEQIDKAQRAVYGDRASAIEYKVEFETDGTAEQNIELYRVLCDSDKSLLTEYEHYISIDSRDNIRSEFYSLYGGMLFLGIFLGIQFLMATVLIIYYKQMSEGYEDCERFKIMQKVGMSHTEVRRSINSQVLTVFFLPIVAAAIHIAAAFNMIRRLLWLFGLTNIMLFAICTLVTFVLFAIIYTLVYRLTSRAYMRIVK